MEGANLSGDLADPGGMIGRGTLAAVGASFALYMLLIITFSMNFDRNTTLHDNYLTFFQDR